MPSFFHRLGVRCLGMSLLAATLTACPVSTVIGGTIAANSVADTRRAAVDALDSAMRQIQENSESWQQVLTGLSNKLPEDVRSTFRNEIDQQVNRAVAQAGTEFKCSSTFLANKAVEAVANIKATILGQTVPVTPPEVCHAIPDQISLAAAPLSREKVVFVGYDFDHRDPAGRLPEVILMRKDGSIQSLPAQYIAQTTHYQITVNTSTTNGVPFNDQSQKLELRWNGGVLSQVNIAQPPPPPPPPPPPSQITRTFPDPYVIHAPGVIFGGSGTDRHEPKPLLPEGCKVLGVQLQRFERNGPVGVLNREVRDGDTWARIDQDNTGTRSTRVTVSWGHAFGAAIRYQLHYTIEQPAGVDCWP